MTPEHLGGHQWKTHVDSGVLEYFLNEGATSLVDVGCGPGGNVLLARQMGIFAFGVDGDPELQVINQTYENLIILHDYSQAPLELKLQDGSPIDLAFSTEFLEHVDEQYIPNYMATFQSARVVCATHALPGMTTGHHHVTLQTEDWWLRKFSEYGFLCDERKTMEIRSQSTMRRDFMRMTGKVFVNVKI